MWRAAALSLLWASSSAAQSPDTLMDAARLAHSLDRVAGTARVLYVAAHPDDENTRLLAYLANVRHVQAAYLSMTRGGGGQNLIGGEQRELLDVLRTEELLAARRLDGAAQRFSRMVDFGYSKRADETLQLWGRDEALADVVWVIRTFQPDVIVARFDELPPNHGHHTASAILAREAFAAAADAKRFPRQLEAGAQVWQATRLVHNFLAWRDKTPPADALSLDVGAYDPRLGLGMGELAALSRSQHKSQGFGAGGERGVSIERFVHVAGSKAETDLLDGVAVGWERFGTAGAPLAAALGEARANLDRDAPERAVPALARAHAALTGLPDGPRVRDARAELGRLIAAAAGLFVRAVAERPGVVPGGTVPMQVEVVRGRAAEVTLRQLIFPGGRAAALPEPLATHAKQTVKHELAAPKGAAVSAPYWLATVPRAGHHVVADARLVGAARGPEAFVVRLELTAAGHPFTLEVPVVHAWTDRVHGERLRPLLVMPPATVTPLREAVIFANAAPAPVHLRVRAAADAVDAEVALQLPKGWKAAPAALRLQLRGAGDEATVRFEVTPPDKGATVVELQPRATVKGSAWSWREDVIDYPHVPLQVVLQPARVRAVPAAVAVPPGLIGYVPGSGDSIADDLAHVGARVEQVADDVLQTGDLSRYAAIVLGIRAYNIRPVLRTVHDRLLRYVEAGGTVVVQYNTNSRLDVIDFPIGPYELEIGRDRITDETAAMTAKSPSHRVLLTPNRLEPADYEGWVQERGLYFASKWDARYEPVYSVADPGEAPLEGGLLVARLGRGRWAYTGLSFFRQLPAGVPGAYRLLLNLLAPESTPEPADAP